MDRFEKNKSDEELLKKLKEISAKGHNAEVKQDKNGKWVVYEVKKENTTVG